MPSSARTFFLLVTALLASAAMAGPGIVETRAGRVTGAVGCAGGTFTVDGKAVPFDQIIYVVHEPGVRTIGGSHVVRLTNGEVWSAEVLSLGAGKLKVRFDLFGEATVGLDRVSSVDFTPTPAAGATLVEGTLYRRTGEPIPGKVLWIDATVIAMDSPLGVLKLKREGASRYVFKRNERPLPAGAVAPAGEEDGISLVDGSLLRGRLKLGPEGLMLEHRAIGAMAIPGSAWRSLSRRHPSYSFMTEVRPASVTAYGLVLEKPPGSPLTYLRGDTVKVTKHGFFKALAIRPKSVVRFRLPPAAGGTSLLRGSVGTAAGSRGDVRVQITTAEGTVFEKELSAGSAPVPLAVELGGDGEVTVAVDFGPRIGFPCEAVFYDPIVIATPRAEEPPEKEKGSRMHREAKQQTVEKGASDAWDS